MIKGIQPPVSVDLIDDVLAGIHRLEMRVAELERLQQPPAHYLFKPFGEEAPTTGTALVWTVPKDVDGLRLEIAEASLVDSGGSNTEIQLVNLTQSAFLFYSNLFINSGDEHSEDSSPEVEIDHTANQVFWRNKISIDILSIGSGSTGLGITLGFV